MSTYDVRLTIKKIFWNFLNRPHIYHNETVQYNFIIVKITHSKHIRDGNVILSNMHRAGTLHINQNENYRIYYGYSDNIMKCINVWNCKLITVSTPYKILAVTCIISINNNTQQCTENTCMIAQLILWVEFAQCIITIMEICELIWNGSNSNVWQCLDNTRWAT